MTLSPSDLPAQDALLAEFERNRSRLLQLARRMLNDSGEAEEIVQDAWLRLLRGQPDDLRSISAWLTTIVTRLCLDALRSRSRENKNRASLDAGATEPFAHGAKTPEQHVQLADSIGVALLVVLDQLKPAERVAFILHDVFDLPFEEIGPLIERSEDNARQLASRARRRVHGAGDAAKGNWQRHQQLAEKFLTAARTGDLAGLMQLLDPDIAMHTDRAAAQIGPGEDLQGAQNIASFFINRGASSASVALIDGQIGFLVARGDSLLLVIKPKFDHDRIVHLEVIAEPITLAALNIGIA